MIEGSTHDEFTIFDVLYVESLVGPVTPALYPTVVRDPRQHARARADRRRDPGAVSGDGLPEPGPGDQRDRDRRDLCLPRAQDRRCAVAVRAHLQYELDDPNVPQIFVIPPASIPFGSYHAADLPFLFDSPLRGGHAPFTPDQEALAAAMVGLLDAASRRPARPTAGTCRSGRATRVASDTHMSLRAADATGEDRLRGRPQVRVLGLVRGQRRSRRLLAALDHDLGLQHPLGVDADALLLEDGLGHEPAAGRSRRRRRSGHRRAALALQLPQRALALRAARRRFVLAPRRLAARIRRCRRLTLRVAERRTLLGAGGTGRARRPARSRARRRRSVRAGSRSRCRTCRGRRPRCARSPAGECRGRRAAASSVRRPHPRLRPALLPAANFPFATSQRLLSQKVWNLARDRGHLRVGAVVGDASALARRSRGTR